MPFKGCVGNNTDRYFVLYIIFFIYFADTLCILHIFAYDMIDKIYSVI